MFKQLLLDLYLQTALNPSIISNHVRSTWEGNVFRDIYPSVHGRVVWEWGEGRFVSHLTHPSPQQGDRPITVQSDPLSSPCTEWIVLPPPAPPTGDMPLPSQRQGDLPHPSPTQGELSWQGEAPTCRVNCLFLQTGWAPNRVKYPSPHLPSARSGLSWTASLEDKDGGPWSVLLRNVNERLPYCVRVYLSYLVLPMTVLLETRHILWI